MTQKDHLDNTQTVVQKYIDGSVKGIVFLSIIVVFIMLVLSGYSYINNTRNDVVSMESDLMVQYPANMAYLSSYVGGFYEMLGVTNLKSEKMDKILIDSVKGRYEGNGGFSPNGAFFSAIKEAYPDLSGLNSYDKIIDYSSAKREGYRADQVKLLSMLRNYDNYINSNIVRSLIVKNIFNAPTRRLKVRVGDKEYIGQDAIDKMLQIVLVEGVTESYETGKMKPLSVNDIK